MKRSEIINKLQRYKAEHQEKYQFKRIGIFGSVARGNPGEQSDLDVIVEQKAPDMFLLGSIKSDLEEALGMKVDVIRLRKEMNAFLKKRIEQEAIYV